MHTRRIIAVGIAATLALAAALPLVAGDGKIMVSDAFARETPPNARVGGAYMTLMNHGPANRLVGVRSDAASKVEIHSHTVDSAGVMRMREVEGGVPLGMHETVVFEPGGLHVMFMGLAGPLRKGESVDVVLEFEDGSTVDVVIPVKSISAKGPVKHDHGMKHEH